jgi:hypothetical protein
MSIEVLRQIPSPLGEFQRSRGIIQHSLLAAVTRVESIDTTAANVPVSLNLSSTNIEAITDSGDNRHLDITGATSAVSLANSASITLFPSAITKLTVSYGILSAHLTIVTH